MYLFFYDTTLYNQIILQGFIKFMPGRNFCFRILNVTPSCYSMWSLTILSGSMLKINKQNTQIGELFEYTKQKLKSEILQNYPLTFSFFFFQYLLYLVNFSTIFLSISLSLSSGYKPCIIYPL